MQGIGKAGLGCTPGSDANAAEGQVDLPLFQRIDDLRPAHACNFQAEFVLACKRLYQVDVVAHGLALVVTIGKGQAVREVGDPQCAARQYRVDTV